MGVPVDCSADRAWRSGPRLEAGNPVTDRPAHQTIDGHASVGANACRVDPSDFPTVDADDESPQAGVGDEYVRSATEDGDRQAELARDLQRTADVLAAARVNQPVRPATDFERRERRQRRVMLYACVAEHCAKPLTDDVRHHTPPSDRRCSLNASTAAAREQSANSIQSPGASWPASGRSALITTPIFGYPPVV